ncbi:hypothetical protein CQA49_08275 [Helicobacter sp. MIT 00-7814]|uniref:hypothetical protein n=1 Tax=unclassified Helicobacter TaxID=2593540 RepID=UPI000E1F8C34|nr:MULTISPECIES: hypothetical protein [unclassified Helicobacter]RDU52150.1 hypothetical protein CQA37_08890 [Helicobacter sp. MIT 99-10781]RDU52541.1 hypothetical protein CQA49_08275 [Helicobacter sp. MIT 00-7814]
MKKLLKKTLAKLKNFFLHENLQRLEQILMAQGKILSLQNAQITHTLKSSKSQIASNANKGGGQ